MNYWRRKSVLLLGFILLTSSYIGNAVAIDIRIGVLAARGSDATIRMWEPTANYLSNQIDGYRFFIVPVTNSNIEKKIAAGELHFTLTNPALYATLENEQGLSHLATLKTKQLGQAYTEFGAVIFTRADRHDLGSLVDLKGKSFIAVHPRAFGGWWMALHEFKKIGIDPTQFLSKIKWGGFPQDDIVLEVLNGQVDAGTVRTNTIERLAFEGKIKLADIRVLNARSEPGFPFLLSTPLFPEWAFAKLKNTTAEVADQVAVLLLAMPSDSVEAVAAESAGWTLPLNYQSVHNLMHDLRVGPYKKLATDAQIYTIDRYVAILLIIVLGLILAGIFGALRNKQSTHAKHMIQNLANEHATEMFEAVSELEKRNTYFEKRAKIIHSFTLSPSDKLQQLLILGCELLGVTQASVDKIDPVSGKFIIVEQVLCEDKYNNVINHEHYISLKKTLIERAFEVGDSNVSSILSVSASDNNLLDEQSGIRTYVGAAIYVERYKYGVLSLIGVSSVACAENGAREPWKIQYVNHISYLIGQLIEKEMLMQRVTVMNDVSDLGRVG